MPFRVDRSLTDHYSVAKAAAREMRDFLVGADKTSGWRARLAAGPVSARDFVMAGQMIRRTLDVLAVAAAQPDLATEARREEQDPAYNVAAEYAAMRDALTAIGTELFTSFPKQIQGGVNYWLVSTYDTNFNEIVRAFSTAQTATLRGLIDSYTATVS